MVRRSLWKSERRKRAIDAAETGTSGQHDYLYLPGPGESEGKVRNTDSALIFTLNRNMPAC